MKIEAINKGSEAKALAFQEFLGFTLPDDYFNFLAQNDGATIDEAYFYVKDIEEYIMFDLFYNIEKMYKKSMKSSVRIFRAKALSSGEIQEEECSF